MVKYEQREVRHEGDVDDAGGVLDWLQWCKYLGRS
jgi:hypothetical protein